MDLRIACFQMNILWHLPNENLKKIINFLSKFNQDIDIFILPEMFTTGFTKENYLFDDHYKEVIFELKKLAKEKNNLIVGSIIYNENHKYFNRLYAFFPDGGYQFYDKRHLFTMAKEDQFYEPGQNKIIIEYKNWKILPLICFDLRFPVWSRNLLKENKGYDLAIYVANWPKARVEHWSTLLKARAIENQCYVVGCNRVGVDGYQIEYNGASAIYDFEGKTLAYSENQETILFASLSYENLLNYRKNFPAYLSADNFNFI
jgi:predicted amidohydrolase